MRCLFPVRAYKKAGGGIGFGPSNRTNVLPLDIRCGKCIACRITRRTSWAIRASHEYQMSDNAYFITLTQDDEHHEPLGVDIETWQVFAQALRDAKGPFRYFCCGEYGSEFKRPHYHAIIYNTEWKDLRLVKRDPSGIATWDSAELDKIWGRGFTSLQDVNYQACNYVAGYVCKKWTGKKAREHYETFDPDTGEVIELKPEFGQASLRPGLGYTWFEKYWKQTYRDDFVVMRGKKFPVPKYYDKLLERHQPDIWEAVKARRAIKGELELTKKANEAYHRYAKADHLEAAERMKQDKL